MEFQFFVLVTLISSTIAQQCSNTNDIRLVGSSLEGMGRLEVRNQDGEWGSVCPDKWPASNAGLVCSLLCGENSTDTTSLRATEHFGPITNAIKVFDTKCNGYEDSFLECNHNWNTTRSCYEDKAVGLCCLSGDERICNGKNNLLEPTIKFNFTCDYDSYTLTIKSPPSENNLFYAFELFSFTNPSCQDKKTNQNATHNWIKTKFIGDCGVTQEVSGRNFSYVHQILIKGIKTEKPISRYFKWLLPVACRFHRDLNNSIHIDTSYQEGDLSNKTGVTEDMLPLDMSIKVFKNDDYQTELETPVQLPVGTPLYIELSVGKLELHGGDNRSKIIVTKCVSYPYNFSDPELHHIVINDRQAVDEGTTILRSPKLNAVRFKMQTFKIGTNYREVYLSCGAYVCPSSDKDEVCVGKAALAQHWTKASRNQFAITDKGSSEKKKTERMVESTSFGVVLPKFTSTTARLTKKDVPQLGEKDYILKGPDNKLYHFKASRNDYIVGLYKGTGIM